MLSWPVQIKIILFRVSYLGDAQCASQRAMRGMRAMRGRHARHAENARHVARHWQHVRHELSRSQFFFSSLLLGSYAWSTPF